MIRLTVDTIWSSRLLLKRIKDYNLTNIDELFLGSTSAVSLDVLIELAVLCGWIDVEGTALLITERCNDFIFATDIERQYREILSDYIIKASPTWSKRIPYGRKEAFIFMNKDEQACFYEAGLMNDDPEAEEIEWWDRMANHIRSQENLRKNETGRKGELYTILYERNRVGIKPQWVSLDSNLSGYDIISKVSSDDNSKLLIEVKSSEMNMDIAEFYISVNEWHTACNSKNYCFYLWCLHSNQKWLAIIKANDLLPFIPTNNETGEWQTVRIPFKSFRQLFTEIA